MHPSIRQQRADRRYGAVLWRSRALRNCSTRDIPSPQHLNSTLRRSSVRLPPLNSKSTHYLVSPLYHSDSSSHSCHLFHFYLSSSTSVIESTAGIRVCKSRVPIGPPAIALAHHHLTEFPARSRTRIRNNGHLNSSHSFFNHLSGDHTTTLPFTAVTTRPPAPTLPPFLGRRL